MAADDDAGDAPAADEADAWESYIKMAKTFGTGWLKRQIKPRLKQIVVKLLQQHEPDDLERLILANYPIVEKDLPGNTRSLLSNYGHHFEEAIIENINPDQIITWLENPDWLDEDETEEREELQEFADVLQNTPGGMEWLSQQTYQLYTIAGITNEDK